VCLLCLLGVSLFLFLLPFLSKDIDFLSVHGLVALTPALSLSPVVVFDDVSGVFAEAVDRESEDEYPG